MRRLGICLLVFMVLLISSVRKDNHSDFQFVLSYGVGGKDRISTINNTIRVDTIKGIKEIHLALSEDDMHLIKNQIIESSILTEDYSFLAKKTNIRVTPCSKFSLYILFDNQEYMFNWTSNNMVPFSIENGEIIVEDKYKEDFRKFTNLNNLVSFINDTIYRYDEIRELPRHMLYL